MDQLEGTLTRIYSHKAGRYNPTGTKFLVGQLSGTTIMGELRKPVEGAAYRLYGRWDDARPPYSGKVFRFDAHEPLVDRSAHSIAQCLADHVDGIGASKAHALAAAFGEDTLGVLRAEPGRAAEVRGITAENVDALRTFFANDYQFDAAAYAALIELFAGQGFPKKTIKKLLELFGSDAPSFVRDRPYLLLAMRGIGWTRADRFALSRVGYDARGRDRQVAALAEALERLGDDGHTYGSRGEVEGIAFGLLGYRPDADAWGAAIEAEEIVEFAPSGDAGDGEPPAYALPAIYQAEATIAERLEEIAAAARPISYCLDSGVMNEDQVAACEVLRQNGAAILAGGPGTGKSFTIARVIAKLQRRGVRRIKACAPTGKAAKRLAELLEGAGVSGVPSTTIHRLLGPAPSDDDEGIPGSTTKVGRGRDEYGFAASEAEPLEVDVLVCDEMSMVDVRLMASLLRAVPAGCRLIMVGDPNQLPSVGPGSVLRDMIAAGVPTATLSKIVRSRPGRVIEACHAIMAGRTPAPAADLDLDAGDNWIHIEAADPFITPEILGLYELFSNFDPVWDVQVISAQKEKFPFACEAINRVLCRKLNPHAARELASADPEHLPAFVVGDKVCRVKNGKVAEMVPLAMSNHGPFDGKPDVWRWRGEDYELSEGYAVNGDLGSVEDVVIDEAAGKSWVVVRFKTPERLARLPYGDAHLIQAYALTCHKFQGSGAPVVIVPVSGSFYFDPRKGAGLWTREQFYTSISRAEVVAITVGPFAAIPLAVGRPTLHVRRTTLARRIAASIEPALEVAR